MNSIAISKRALGFAATTAMAGALLSSCTTSAAPPATLSANMAEAALAEGKSGKAITHAEAAVLAAPHNAAYRAMLASAYLDAGRFASAATSFEDAMKLGDNSPRTALSLALAWMGQGKQAEAAQLLNEWESEIAIADVGLALALAGQPERGAHLMANAIRGGENSAKMRQNLAYAYALAGRWREARLMAEQDLPGEKINERIEEWSRLAQPDAWQHRIAALLQVPAGVADAGQPVQLALANNPDVDQLAAEANAFVPSPAAPAFVQAPVTRELPALQPIEPNSAFAQTQAPETERPANFQGAFAGPAAQPAPRAVQPAVQTAQGTHLVQLGSFISEEGARRAWSLYVRKYPELAGHEMVITEALVRGKRYWRVSAGGFAAASASSMCGKVRSGGQGCIAYAEGRPLPGAVDNDVRMARR